MHIAQISTLDTPVAATGSGSIESLVWLLARELTAMGHEVTVFGAAGSELAGGALVTTLPGTYGNNGAPDDWELCEWIGLCKAVERACDFDVLHSHNYLWGIPLEVLSAAPMVHTLHVSPVDDHRRLRKMRPSACVTGISRFQWDVDPRFAPFDVVYHGVNQQAFTFQECAGDYACYLGRFISGKGVLRAVETARAMELPLRLAGPANDYFRKNVEPLVDATYVRYEGTVTGARRDALLGGARVLLYPVEAAEPFGLVMAEAMTCGTPVAAMRLGAVPEIVEEGVTGYSTETPAEYPDAVRRCLELDRAAVRERARQRFSARRMAGDYLRVYERLIAERSARTGVRR
jgi:glycosyltransferase involved in cell wall biosynthesis